MKSPSFQIPGLGHAKPDEQLPIQNFAPDLLAAAASIGSVSGVPGLDESSARMDVLEEKKDDQTNEVPQDRASTVPRVSDNMDVDEKGASSGENGDKGRGSEERQIPSAVQNATTVDAMKAISNNNDVDMADSPNPPPSPGVASALEAALEGMISEAKPQPKQGDGATEDMQAIDGAQRGQVAQRDGDAGEGAEHLEWEVDSSPYQTSSESDSSDSSSDGDSEDEGGYPLLGIEETARLLMAEDGDDGSSKPGKGASAPLRTKNEMPDDILPKPDVTITPEMKIEPLGDVQFIVEDTAVINSHTPGEIQVLERGSVLCKEDRTVIGALTDILGNVKSPVYIVRFATDEEIAELGLEVGLKIFYSVEHAVYALTQAIRDMKGCDASNLHDEEVGVDEMEFSDDEKEAEYRKQRKQKGRAGKGGRGGYEMSTQQHCSANYESAPANPSGNLNYDEEEDGPYKPLPRPSAFAQGASAPSLPPKPESSFGQSRGGSSNGQRGSHRGGRGDFRGRNHRGGRGGGRGSDRKFGGHGGAHSSYRHDGSPSSAHPLPQPPSAPQSTHGHSPSFSSTSPIPPPVPPPVQASHWPVPSNGGPPTPFPFPYPVAQGQVPPPPPPTAGFSANQPWAQLGQQYPYGQTAAGPQVSVSAPPATNYPAVPAPAWSNRGWHPAPGAWGGHQQSPQTTQQPAQPPAPQYAQYAHYQQPQQQPQQQYQQQQQQQYWGQQSYGQGRQ